jgi:4-azaleucine resistance transporter AzlC
MAAGSMRCGARYLSAPPTRTWRIVAPVVDRAVSAPLQAQERRARIDAMTQLTSATTASRSGTFTRHGVRRGFIAAQPLAIGVFIYGITFGLLALGSGLSVIDALLMSATIYSATAQVAALSTLAQDASIFICVSTVVLLNARYLLYGAALRPWLGQASPLGAYGTLYLLGDANWLLSMRAHDTGEDDAGFVLGSGLATFMPWLVGTLLGGAAGHWIPSPHTLGLDFLLVAFCAAMLMGMWRARTSLWPAVGAFVAAAAADRWAPPGWTVVAAGLTGAAVAAWRHRDAPDTPAAA